MCCLLPSWLSPASLSGSISYGMLWGRDGDTYTADVSDLSGTVVFHLVVEAVSDGSWTWAVWRPGDPPRLARYGTAGTIQEAMDHAEQAAQ